MFDTIFFAFAGVLGAWLLIGGVVEWTCGRMDCAVGRGDSP